MTRKQIEALTYIYLHGSDDLLHLSGRVLYNCFEKGWLELDEDEPWALGAALNQCDWILTDAGRLALHEATS